MPLGSKACVDSVGGNFSVAVVDACLDGQCDGAVGLGVEERVVLDGLNADSTGPARVLNADARTSGRDGGAVGNLGRDAVAIDKSELRAVHCRPLGEGVVLESVVDQELGEQATVGKVAEVGLEPVRRRKSAPHVILATIRNPQLTWRAPRSC